MFYAAAASGGSSLMPLLMISLPLMIASYQYLVRYSFIGAVLNGRRVRPGGELAPAAATT